jgi:hypothetical protein
MPAGEAPPPDAVAPEGHKAKPGAGAMHGDHTIHRILTRPAAAVRAVGHASPLVLIIAAVVVVTMLLGPGFLLPLLGPRSRGPVPRPAAPKPETAAAKVSAAKTAPGTPKPTAPDRAPLPAPRIPATTHGVRPPRT